ncbi:MAG: glycosyltransferase family 39 protein [Patescibacteria group bacterium]
MNKNLVKIFICVVVFIATFLPRLYRLNNPVADWHSWRQADTAAVARNFVKSDFNLLYPQSDSFLILNTARLPNPNRYFINEFPFYNAIVAVLYRQFGIHESIARLVSVFFASLGAVFLFWLTQRLFGYKIAALTSLFYAFNPYNIYYGRVIMPDPLFISLSIISLYLFVRYQFILFSLVFALALLVKPYSIFILLPCFYWAIINRKLRQFFFSLISLVPFLLWRWHFNQHPEASFDTIWLFNGQNIRFTGAFFRWLIFDRMNRLIFATGGFVLFILGLLTSYLDKTRGLILAWFLSVVAYMCIFAMGNVTHDYYQLPLMPVGAILVSFGFWHIVDSSRKFFIKTLNILLAVSLLVLSFAFGWYEVRGYFNINHPEIVTAGQAVDRLTPPDALVIAPYTSDPAFLYQTNRYGWPEGVNLEAKVSQGAQFYISVNFDSVEQYLESKCRIVSKTDVYALIDIQNCL